MDDTRMRDRARHLDLIEQAEASEREQLQARRVLGPARPERHPAPVTAGALILAVGVVLLAWAVAALIAAWVAP